jgi:hypothetical protein
VSKVTDMSNLSNAALLFNEVYLCMECLASHRHELYVPWCEHLLQTLTSHRIVLKSHQHATYVLIRSAFNQKHLWMERSVSPTWNLCSSSPYSTKTSAWTSRVTNMDYMFNFKTVHQAKSLRLGPKLPPLIRISLLLLECLS